MDEIRSELPKKFQNDLFKVFIKLRTKYPNIKFDIDTENGILSLHLKKRGNTNGFYIRHGNFSISYKK